jgi:hypothetical protein
MHSYVDKKNFILVKNGCYKKRGWGELKRLLKGYSNSQEPATHEGRGGVSFIGI